MLQKFEEKRGVPRHPLDRVAKIKLGADTPPLYCIVTDTSEGGVRINFNVNGFNVPDEFVLLLAGDGPAQEGTYRVIWRRDAEVGAKLVRVTQRSFVRT